MESILELWETAPNGEQMQKALDAAKEEKRKAAEPKSAIIDPGNNYGIGGTRSKQAIIPFSMLRAMAKVPAIAAILLTRKNQVARFARRPRFDGDVGFRIGLKDFKKKMTDAEQKEAFEIEEFFLKTGAIKNRKRKDNFNAFLRKITDDTLTLDALTFEKVPFAYKDGLAEIWATDAATVELVANAPVGENNQPIVYEPMTRGGAKLGADNIAYVQRLNGQIEAEFSEDDLAYAIRNPRTDITTVDFGTSELEVLIEVVTAILNGTRYNSTYFTHSHLPQGVLEMVGKYQQQDLENFKRHWKQLTSGASGKWAVPVMALQEGQGFKFTPFKNSNKDMEFSQFMEFLFNIACAVYQIDPNEVGFKSWTAHAGMSQSDNTEEKMDKSMDKGFVPLMNFLSDTFNSEIVDHINEKYAFYWVGVDEEDEDRKLERQEKQIELGLRTVQELRKADDCDDLINPATGKPYMWTQAPANATLIQVFMAESGMGQQPGDPNDPEADAQAQQADHDHDLTMQEGDHQHELDKMDKQHEQAKEMKQLDQKHQQAMEKLKAQHAAKADDRKADMAEEADDRKAEHAEAADDRKADMAESADDRKGKLASEADKRKGKQAEAADDRKGKLASDADKRKEGAAASADDRAKANKDKAPDPDDAHEKELEKMKLEHKHELELERLKQKGKPKSTVKKSLNPSEDEAEVLNITITWDEY